MSYEALAGVLFDAALRSFNPALNFEPSCLAIADKTRCEIGLKTGFLQMSSRPSFRRFSLLRPSGFFTIALPFLLSPQAVSCSP